MKIGNNVTVFHNAPSSPEDIMHVDGVVIRCESLYDAGRDAGEDSEALAEAALNLVLNMYIINKI